MLRKRAGGQGDAAGSPDRQPRGGFAVFPEIGFSPVDNVELSTGVFLVDGTGNSLFGRWGDVDQAYIRLRASF